MDETKKKIILIVEDEPSYQHTLAEKLGMEGFDILTARNGEDGLEIALGKHPNLILLDLQMPKMDGIEMAKKLREDEWGKNVKVIILTNLSSTEKVAQATGSNIFEYLIKTDIKLEDLIKKVRELLMA